MQREQWSSLGDEEEKWRLTWRSSILTGAGAAGYMLLGGGSVPSIGGGMAKAGVGFSPGQDFINIFLLVLYKKNS